MTFPALGFVPYSHLENSLQVQHRKGLQTYIGLLKITFTEAVCRVLLHSKGPERNPKFGAVNSYY